MGIAGHGLRITFGSTSFTHHEVNSVVVNCFVVSRILYTCGCFECLLLGYMLREGGDFGYSLNCWNRNAVGDMVRVRIWLHKFIGNRWSPRYRLDRMQGLITLKRVKCTDLIQNRDKMWMLGRTKVPGIVLQPF